MPDASFASPAMSRSRLQVRLTGDAPPTSRPGSKPMRALLILPILLLAACSTPSGKDGGGVVLVNRTDNALLYMAFDLEDGPLVDPNPAIDPRNTPERLVA